MQVGYLFDERGMEDRAYDREWFEGMAFSDREMKLVRYLLKEHRFEPGTPLGARAWAAACLLMSKGVNPAGVGAKKDERSLGGSVRENLAGLHTTLGYFRTS